MAISIYSDQSRQANWYVRKKTDVTLTLTVTQNSSAYDLSSTTFIAEFFQVNGITPFITLTQGSGITNGGATGLVTLALTDTQLDITANQYFWKLRTTAPTDYLWLNGIFQVNDYVWDGNGNSSLTVELTVGNNNIDLALSIGGGSVTLASLGTTLQTATADTPLDADTWNFYDAVDTVLKKITWANIKATLKTYFDTLYAAALGADDNYVTDAEKTKLSNLSGTNTGDQDLSGLQGLIISPTTVTDGANITLTGQNSTLASSQSTINVAITNTATYLSLTVTLTGTNLVLTFTDSASTRCVNSDGTKSGDNTCTLSGTTGDVYEIGMKKRGSGIYSVIAQNINE